jgi:hypothetical protein
MDRILLGQLGANGDCLYATILARQLRQDHPRAHITWAISNQCMGLLRNNPDVDEVWEVPVSGWDEHGMAWRIFEREALRRYQRRDFDLVLLSQIWPSHFENYDGTVRPSILRSYGSLITVPIENVICLTDEEIENVDRFVKETHLLDCEHRILFECSSKSGQSFVTPEFAQAVAGRIYDTLGSATVIFSTHLPMTIRDRRSRYAGKLSLRESAFLTHHCTLFVGCGSGGTVAASSTASKPLPMIQLLSSSTSVFASFAHDFEYFGITNRPIIEITNEYPQYAADCIVSFCREGFATAKERFGERIPLNFYLYISRIELCLLRDHRYIDAARSLMITARRYGWAKELIDFGMHEIAPRLSLDPSWIFSSNRRVGDELRSALAEANRHPVLLPSQMQVNPA